MLSGITTDERRRSGGRRGLWTIGNFFREADGRGPSRRHDRDEPLANCPFSADQFHSRVPGAAQHERKRMVRCRPGTSLGARPRFSSASLHAALRPGHEQESITRKQHYSTSSTLSGPVTNAFWASAAAMKSSKSPSSTAPVFEGRNSCAPARGWTCRLRCRGLETAGGRREIKPAV
jgi:hypothetical protein